MEAQFSELASNPDIIVATPGASSHSSLLKCSLGRRSPACCVVAGRSGVILQPLGQAHSRTEPLAQPACSWCQHMQQPRACTSQP